MTPARSTPSTRSRKTRTAPNRDAVLRLATAPEGPRDRVTMFACQVDRLRMAEAVERVYGLIDARVPRCRYVVTPNVDHVVMLEHHAALRRAYDDASLVVADGMPVVLASRLLRRSLPERISGTDLVVGVLDAAEAKRGIKVYLLGALPGVADQAAARIVSRWPAVEVVGTYSPPSGFENDPSQTAAILDRIAASRPDLLLVGLGAPKQELWVHEHQHAIDASVAMCVGAAIDFLAGNKRRAPVWMQRSGLEWLHRVASEPRRLAGRYARDAWRFPPIVWREWRKSLRGSAAPAIEQACAEKCPDEDIESTLLEQ